MSEGSTPADEINESELKTEQPVESESDASKPSDDEVLVPQSKVNDLLSHMFHKGKEKGRMEALEQFPEGIPAQDVQATAPAETQQAPTQMGGVPQMSQADIERMIQEAQAKQMQQFQEQQQAQHSTQVKTDLYNALLKSKEKHDDFEDVFGNVDLTNNPEVLNTVHEHISPDLQGEVLYELYKNPDKVVKFYQHLGIQPSHAVAKIKELANSIQTNVNATNLPKGSEPLNTIKPSNVGVDNGSRTVSDLSRDSRFKF